MVNKIKKWHELTPEERVEGLLAYTEGNYDPKDYDSLEDFICLFISYRDSSKRKDTIEEKLKFYGSHIILTEKNRDAVLGST